MDNDMKDRSRERERDRDRSKRSRFSDQSRDRSPDRGRDRNSATSSTRRVYISNIPYECRWQDLKDLFRDNVGDVQFVELFVDENDKPRGCGIVEFVDSASVEKALKNMHRFEYKGRKIVIKEDYGNQRDKYGNLLKRREGAGGRGDESRDRRDDRRHYDGGSGLAGENKWGNTYGLSPAFLEELNIFTPLCTKVFVANLEYKVDKKKLKEVFRMAGKIQHIDMPVDKDGQRRGFAVIEYDHPVESVQAISMFHNHSLYDRIMTVRLDRSVDTDKLPDGLKSIGRGLGANGEPLKDVARNLPSLQNNTPAALATAAAGAGILGAVPNLQQLGAAGALGGLGNVSSALNPSAVLQAAAASNFTGVGGLPNNLLATDLNLAANLVQNNPSLVALAASSNNMNSTASNTFNRSNENQFPPSNTGGGFNSGNSSLMSRNYQSFDSKPSFSFGPTNERPSNNGNLFSSNNGSTLLRNTGNVKNYSKKIIISNLPSTATYKLVSDKCQEFGSVEDVEQQQNGNIIVTFHTEWEAERAIKNMDRARIDGRTIDVGFY